VSDAYLIDTSAVWRILSNENDLRLRWLPFMAEGLLRHCMPTRLEVLFGARNAAHRMELEADLDELFPPVGMPKDPWRWAERTQYELTGHSQHRGPGVVDLLVAATAVHHDLTVLHVDNDFSALARVQPDLRERDARS
jgi:predicted nucleic acid-binding protein